uniref:Uncharacterized protein n=1 Tax=Panagrolaimus sp. PS1159 TaxID=55785 RepID=A0AC35GG55_9BILA
MSKNLPPIILPVKEASEPSLLFRFLNCDFFSAIFSFTNSDTMSATTAADPENLSRYNLITTVYKQHVTKFKILEPYRQLKLAMKNMQDEYLESRDNNAYTRYNQMIHMIQEVVLLERQYWKNVQIPSQEKLEPSNAYVLKIISLLDDKTNQTPVTKTNGIASFFGPKTINVTPSTKYQNSLEKIRG